MPAAIIPIPCPTKPPAKKAAPASMKNRPIVEARPPIISATASPNSERVAVPAAKAPRKPPRDAVRSTKPPTNSVLILPPSSLKIVPAATALVWATSRASLYARRTFKSSSCVSANEDRRPGARPSPGKARSGASSSGAAAPPDRRRLFFLRPVPTPRAPNVSALSLFCASVSLSNRPSVAEARPLAIARPRGLI